MRTINDFKPFVPSNNYAHSLMLHFMVNSAQEWYDHFRQVGLVEKFEGTKVSKPNLMPWGLIVTQVWDPAGVLLHFAEKPADSLYQSRDLEPAT